MFVAGPIALALFAANAAVLHVGRRLCAGVVRAAVGGGRELLQPGRERFELRVGPPDLRTVACTRQAPCTLRTVIKSVIVHLANELPILVDLLEAPSPTAQSVRCTNVRTVDGKRPSFVHDPKSTFVLPWHLIRLMEVPAAAHGRAGSRQAGGHHHPARAAPATASSRSTKSPTRTSWRASVRSKAADHQVVAVRQDRAGNHQKPDQADPGHHDLEADIAVRRVTQGSSLIAEDAADHPLDRHRSRAVHPLP